MQVADALRGNDGASSSSSVERPSDIAKLTRRVEEKAEEANGSRDQQTERQYRDGLLRATTLRKVLAAVPVHALQAAVAAEQRRKAIQQQKEAAGSASRKQASLRLEGSYTITEDKICLQNLTWDCI